MGIFKNKTFNLVYVHAALQAFVMHGGEGFAFIYLLKAGIKVEVVLLCIGAMFGSRLLFRMAVLPVVLRFGLRNTLICSVIVEGSSYLILPMVSTVGPLLYTYLGLWAISSSFYWTTYHAYVAQIGNNEHRGAQVSAMEFFGMSAGIIAPLAMGALLTWFQPWVGFGVISAMMALAAVPFMFGPAVDVKPNVVLAAKSKNKIRFLLSLDGMRSAATHFLWLIALFLTLKSSFISFGGALAFAGLTGAFVALFVGKRIDMGHKNHAIRFGYGAIILSSIFKCFGFDFVWGAVASNAFYSAAWPSYATAFNSQVYNLARKSPCALRFHVLAEGGWDLGMTIGSVCAAIMVYLGLGFFWPLALGVVSCSVGYFALRRVMQSELSPALDTAQQET